MKFRRALIAGGIFLIAALILYFLFRNTLLRYAFSKVKTRSYQSYGLRLSVAELHFSGIDHIRFNHLVLQPEDADTLLKLEGLECNVSFADLLTGTIGFDEIRVNGGYLTLFNKSNRNNLRFLAERKGAVQKQTYLADFNFREKDERIRRKLFQALHTAFYLNDINISYTDSALTEALLLPHAEYDLHSLSALLINQAADDSLELVGNVLERDKSYHLTVLHSGDANAYLPFFNREHGLKCRFQSVSATITLQDTPDELQIATDCEGTDFHLNHWRIANGDVSFPNPRFKGIWKIRDDAIELDSSSTFFLQDVPLKVFANYSTKTGKRFSLNMQMPETVSDSFFHALPEGMFGTLKGISCTGTLAYQMQFFIDTQQPDSLTFSSSLTRKDFRLNHYGAENYGRINAPFVYDAYDKDRFVRKIIIGPENPMFTPLYQMNAYLPKAVLQSEDPSFMQHRGFLPEAFRESIVKNFKERRFARGGSTIAMQLVKNVFLSRDKTISRKLEEALIVYLIENLSLVSKERMLEIYLNVIEWGPNVYGIGEASRFYFNKHPSELTLQESIFLASIIPAPKYFRYQFDKQGKLKPSMAGYFRILSGRMASKAWISSSDTTGLLPEVKLLGPALRFILPADSLPPQQEEDF
jgi:hypothetical protein